MSKPGNKITRTDQTDALVEFAAAGGFPGSDRYSSHIEAQEARGQRELVHSDRLPTKGYAEKDLTDLGFTLGDADPSDPMFRPATLPEGWSREGSDHAMWSYIVDANGRRRVAIFYKAAYYDRDAFARLETHSGVASHLLWTDPEPTSIDLDDWFTADVARRELTEARDGELTKAAEQDSYYPEGAATARERAARADRLIALLPTAEVA